MSAYDVDPKRLRKCFSIAKLVKPVANDYSVEFNCGFLQFSSVGKRHVVASRVFVSSDIENSEFLLPVDRSGVVDISTVGCKLSVLPKGLNLKYVTEGNTRNANIKRRAESSRKTRTPALPEFNGAITIRKDDLDFILRHLSASAQIKNTKTEEDMRINQVFFNASKNEAVANARYYATSVKSTLIDFDLSVVSSDIPIIRSFIDNFDVIDIVRAHDSIYLMDKPRESWLRINNHRSDAKYGALPTVDIPSHSFHVQKESLKDMVKWSTLTVDGSQRVSINLVGDLLRILSNSNELAATKVHDSMGGFTADFPLSVLATVVDYLDDGNILIGYSFDGAPDIITLTQANTNSTAVHYIRSMKTQ